MSRDQTIYTISQLTLNLKGRVRAFESSIMLLAHSYRQPIILGTNLALYLVGISLSK